MLPTQHDYCCDVCVAFFILEFCQWLVITSAKIHDSLARNIYVSLFKRSNTKTIGSFSISLSLLCGVDYLLMHVTDSRGRISTFIILDNTAAKYKSLLFHQKIDWSCKYKNMTLIYVATI